MVQKVIGTATNQVKIREQ